MARSKTETGEGQLGLDAITLADEQLYDDLELLEQNDQERAGNEYPRLMQERSEITGRIKERIGLEGPGVYEFVVTGAKGTKERRFKATVSEGGTESVSKPRTRITPQYAS